MTFYYTLWYQDILSGRNTEKLDLEDYHSMKAAWEEAKLSFSTQPTEKGITHVSTPGTCNCCTCQDNIDQEDPFIKALTKDN